MAITSARRTGRPSARNPLNTRDMSTAVLRITRLATSVLNLMYFSWSSGSLVPIVAFPKFSHVAKPAQQGDRAELALADRDGHPHQVFPVRLDQLPVDRLAEQGVDVGVGDLGVGPEEHAVLEVADAWQQVEPEQVGQPEDREALPLGIGVDLLRLGLALLLQQPVNDVDGLPHPAGEKAREKGDVVDGK